jgi:broad specificity phosphatase PhoE
VSSILLIRHGQASFGAADYDQLSGTGAEQSRALGAALRARGVVPDVVVAGRMRRHAQTATALLTGGGWDLPLTTDPGWDEFDHLQVLSVHTPPASGDAGGHGTSATDEKAQFQRWFEGATRQWTSGAHDERYDESFSAFGSRVAGALDRLVSDLPRGGTAVVLTSGGPIAWAASCLLADDPAHRADLWSRLNPVSINTGVSTVVVGSRGATLVTWNAHDHLSPDLLTYR